MHIKGKKSQMNLCITLKYACSQASLSSNSSETTNHAVNMYKRANLSLKILAKEC